MQTLGRLVRARREYLSLGQGDLADLGGPKVSTVGKIERAAQANYPTRTQQQIERALGWDLGTVRRILAAPAEPWWRDKGMREDFEAELVEAAPPALAPAATTARDVTDDELAAEVTYRLRRYADELRTRQEQHRERTEIPTSTTAGESPAPELDLSDVADRIVNRFRVYAEQADEARKTRNPAESAAWLARLRSDFERFVVAELAQERPNQDRNVG